MKKKIFICISLLLILITAILFIIAAVESYNYDMDAANGVDIMEGFGAVLAILVGGFAVFYELDLFYTLYYFFFRTKTVAKSILNIFSNLALLSVVFTDSISHFLSKNVSSVFNEEIIVLFALLFIYFVLRSVCAMIPNVKTSEEN
ncbi:MAG: hypothetical protein IKU45_04400 [Clostridia bacterium]|nr:hypothetical protein [Clostridia bacterium]